MSWIAVAVGVAVGGASGVAQASQAHEQQQIDEE